MVKHKKERTRKEMLDLIIINKEGLAKLSRTDWDALRVVQSRNDGKCRGCGKELKAGSIGTGTGWYKFCLDCSLKRTEEFSKSVEELKQLAEELRENIIENRAAYDKHTMIANLKSK